MICSAVINGPPFASGRFHFGSIRNQILKDYIVRIGKLDNICSNHFYCFDSKGLPIERAVNKETVTGEASWIESCKLLADNNVEVMLKDLSLLKLVTSVSEDRVVRTTDLEYCFLEQKLLSQLYEKGKMYRSLRPNTFCPTCVTNLSHCQITNAKATKNVAIFPVNTEITITGKKLCLLPVTSEPYSILGHSGIALRCDHVYTVVEDQETHYLIDNITELPRLKQLKVFSQDATIVSSLNSNKLEGYRYMWDGAILPIILTPEVRIRAELPLLQGAYYFGLTATLHLSPYHSSKDLTIMHKAVQQEVDPLTYSKDNIEQSKIVEKVEEVLTKSLESENKDIPADVTATAKQSFYYNLEDKEEQKISRALQYNSYFIALLRDNYKKNKILEKLKQKFLFFGSYTSQSEECCWRCASVVTQLIDTNWYLNTSSIASNLAEVAKRIWLNEERYRPLLVNFFGKEHEWCLSRTRVYNTLIPYYNCTNSNCSFYQKGKMIVTKCNSFLDYTPLTKIVHNCSCGARMVCEGKSVDVWFNSGVLPYYLNQRARVLIEGVDQCRGWFFALSAIALLLEKPIPYDAIFITGWILEESKQKMSKSSQQKKLTIVQLIEKYGVDAVRAYCLRCASSQDYAFSQTTLAEEAKIIRVMFNLRKLMSSIVVCEHPLSDLTKRLDAEITNLLASIVKSLEEHLNQSLDLSYSWERLRAVILSLYSRALIPLFYSAHSTDADLYFLKLQLEKLDKVFNFIFESQQIQENTVLQLTKMKENSKLMFDYAVVSESVVPSTKAVSALVHLLNIKDTVLEQIVKIIAHRNKLQLHRTQNCSLDPYPKDLLLAAVCDKAKCYPTVEQ